MEEQNNKNFELNQKRDSLTKGTTKERELIPTGLSGKTIAYFEFQVIGDGYIYCPVSRCRSSCIILPLDSE